MDRLNDLGQCNVPPPNADFVAVAGGGFHSLGISARATAVEPTTWGAIKAQFNAAQKSKAVSPHLSE
jgi:hypothetical protein